MCKECGCGIVGEVDINGRPGSEISPESVQGSGAESPTGHSHEESHTHGHGVDPGRGDAHTIAVHQAVLQKNDRLAERNRGYFKAKGLLVLNVVSSPGSGKTTFIQKTAAVLGARLRTGVIVGDLATDNDAARLRSSGVPVVQITTGTVCHLEAEMVARAASQLALDSLDLLIIENVGNLVCPATYDLGEDLRVVLLSVTEGEDKPLKYPPVFHSAQAVIVNKMDLAAACEFDREKTLANLHRISHHARIFEVSARTGQGLEAWATYLVEQHRLARSNAVSK
jgi:hydrogenase nickel incorporation protein HypB